MSNIETNLRIFLLFFEIFSIYKELQKDNELEKGNFDLLWNENYEKEKEEDIFEGYKDFKLDNTNVDIYNTTKLWRLMTWKINKYIL